MVFDLILLKLNAPKNVKNYVVKETADYFFN